MALHLLSGGAAKGVVNALAASFLAETGVAIEGGFGAVGAMKDRLLSGEPCDVVILTAAQIEALSASGHVVPGSGVALGRVPTGIAVREGDVQPDVSTDAAVAAALRAAQAIYVPDTERSTAGIHFVNVLKQLGIHDEVASRLRPYPNGAVAMARMATDDEPHSIGCTQVTEIMYTKGVTLVGPLPKALELVTIYSAAVTTNAADPSRARELVALLTGPKSTAIRAAGGFEL